MLSKEEIDKLYPNPWNFKVIPKFTELEIAVMEGGHSIEVEQKKESYNFIRYLTTKPTLGPLS